MEYCSGDGRAGFHSMKSWGDGAVEKAERGAGVARGWARARRGWSEGGLERRAVAAIALAAAVAACQPQSPHHSGLVSKALNSYYCPSVLYQWWRSLAGVAGSR